MNFSLAPPDYDVDEHGPWVGDKLTPVIALAGDALLEPFWPLGLGLKRGWQAIMDTTYVVDNLYNRTLLCEEKGIKDTDTFSWDDHWEALREVSLSNFESCNRVEVADALGKGEYLADDLVMIQWKKMAAESERPLFLVEVDPNTRYKRRNQTLVAAQKRKMLDDKKWVHPVVQRCMAIIDYTEKCKKDVNYNGWQKLKTYGGREVGAKPKSGYTFKAPGAKTTPKAPINLSEVKEKAEQKRESLTKQVTAAQIEEHITAGQKSRKSQMMAQQANLLAQLKGGGTTAAASTSDLHDLAYVAPDTDSIAESQTAMWDRMLEKGMTPAQTAELQHIRNMIQALNTSIDGYRKAEKAILMGQKK